MVKASDRRRTISNREIANYPRIVISRNFSCYESVRQRDLVLIAEDGIAHLNYFPEMIIHTSDLGSSENSTLISARATKLERDIADNIKASQTEDTTKNWRNREWFKKHFDQAWAALSKDFIARESYTEIDG